MARIMCLGDSRTTFAGWQALLVPLLNTATGAIPSWSYRTNLNATFDPSVSVLGANGAAYLADGSSALAYPTYVLVDLGEHDMVAGTVNQTNFQNSYLALIDAIVAKWFDAEIYLDFPWAVPCDAQYAAVKGYVQNVIAARSMCHAGVDQGVVLKGGDNGATNTSDGIHMNAAGLTAYAAAMKTAMGF